LRPACRSGRAGIDLVVGDLPRVVDANPRSTTSIVGMSKVMREELADLILRARVSTLPERVTVEGECEFRKGELEIFDSNNGKYYFSSGVFGGLRLIGP